MADEIEFAKLSGSGNDFICIDGRDGRFDDLIGRPERAGHFSRTLCRRGLGVGADGVIFACGHEIGELAEVSARFFEADGSEVELCGNGVGCFAHWARVNGWAPAGEIRILTSAGVVRGQDGDGRYVRVCIPQPRQRREGLQLDVDGRRFDCDFVVVGVPHLVTYVDDLADLDVDRWGGGLRRHERFAPRGVNANFVQVIGEGEIAVRTFEFGVEGETLACGTGSAAAAILAARRLGWASPYTTGDRPVLIHARGGDVLRVYFQTGDDGEAADPCLETIVRFVYRGTLHPELAELALRPPGADT